MNRPGLRAGPIEKLQKQGFVLATTLWTLKACIHKTAPEYTCFSGTSLSLVTHYYSYLTILEYTCRGRSVTSQFLVLHYVSLLLVPQYLWYITIVDYTCRGPSGTSRLQRSLLLGIFSLESRHSRSTPAAAPSLS